MGRKRDPETGKYRRSYTDEDFLNLLEETRLATSEIADRLGCHRTTAHSKLRELEERKVVESTEAGSTLIWEAAD